MKANLKRKYQIAREILAEDKNSELSLDKLNSWGRSVKAWRSFTEPLTAHQIAVLRKEVTP